MNGIYNRDRMLLRFIAFSVDFEHTVNAFLLGHSEMISRVVQ